LTRTDGKETMPTVSKPRANDAVRVREKARLAAFGAVLVLLATSNASCSFAFSRGPSNEEAAYFGCSGYISPVLDTIAGAMIGIGAIVPLNMVEKDRQEVSYPRVAAAGLIALTYLASAVHGYRIASACRDQQEGIPAEGRERHRSFHREPTSHPGPRRQ